MQVSDVAPSILFQWILKVNSCQRSWQKFVTTYTHWFPSVMKSLFRKKGEAHVLFRFLRTSLEYFLHLWSVLQHVYFPLFHFYELNFNHYELGLITPICACLGMADFGTYNKSHGPARKNTDHSDFHHGWSVGRPRILVFVQHWRPRRNGSHFLDNILKWIFLNENCMNLQLRFHWNLFLRFELTIFHHWFR